MITQERTVLDVGLAQMLAGGVILDVTTPEQALLAEAAGAAAVMALERVPSDIRKQGGVARMADPSLVASIQESVTIPVMAKCRIGHVAEARVLESLEVDYIDESEVLTPADPEHHIDKRAFRVPFVCGAVNLGEALRRVSEGATLLRTKGEAGTGDVIEAVRHLREIRRALRDLCSAPEDELPRRARELEAPLEVVRATWERGALPVPNFAAGGVATPADAALVMSLGAEAVFVGSGVFGSQDPERMARAIVQAAARWEEPDVVAAACREAGGAMAGRSVGELEPSELLQGRGW